MKIKRYIREPYQPDLYASPISLPERTVGKFSISHRTIEGTIPVVGHRQAILRGMLPVVGKLAQPRRIHQLVVYRQGLWMTDLPEELNQIAEMLHEVQPKGKVLVGGLGLGIVATVVSRLPTVSEVVVIEKSKEVIELCASDEESYKVVKSDILTYLKKHKNPFNYYLLDTWAGTSEVTWWGEVLPLRRAIRQRFGLVPVIHCWAEDIMWGQVRRRLTREDLPPHWYYQGPLCHMSKTEADYFLKYAGTLEWEKKYGAAIDNFEKGD